MTGNTNFKKKLTSFASKFVRASGKIELWKSKLQLKFADTLIGRYTAGAEAMGEQILDLVVFRPFSELLLWMKIIIRDVTFEKFIWKPKCFCTPMKCALQFQPNVSNINRYAGKLHNKALSNLGVFPKKIACIYHHFKISKQTFCSIETHEIYLKSCLTRFFFCRS